MNVTQSTVKGTFIIIKVILWSFPVLSISVEPRGNDIFSLILRISWLFRINCLTL